MLGKSKDDVIAEQRQIMEQLGKQKFSSSMYGAGKEYGDVVKVARGAEFVSVEVHQAPSQPSAKASSQQKNVNPLYEFNRSKNGKK